MPQPRFILAFFLAIALMAGYASTPMQNITSDHGEDSVITTRVITAIFSDHSLKVTAINVETVKGTVQLSGIALSPADMVKAVAVVRSVSGVTAVHNDMRLMTCG